MPMFLKSIGFSIVLIGILEGLAEAVAGLSKGYFGKLSDSTGRRVPFVQAGYALSALSKPMMALLIAPLWIFFARTLDRVGKGLRTGARDALLSAEATPATKATVFGFHRSMDTLGAVIGPAIALVYLYFYPADYTTLFQLAFIPGVLAILVSLFIKESGKAATPPKGKPVPFFAFLHYWKTSPAAYRKLVAGLLVFALFNSSDVFLLLKAKQAGLTDTQVIGIYIFYNLIYALFALPLGMLADKWGLKTIFMTGLGLFAIVYGGMAISHSFWVIGFLFFLYGIYAAATEGIAKAWISNLVPGEDTATAIGSYSGFQSICGLLASSLAGIVWYTFGSTATFLLSALVAMGVLVYFYRMQSASR